MSSTDLSNSMFGRDILCQGYLGYDLIRYFQRGGEAGRGLSLIVGGLLGRMVLMLMLEREECMRMEEGLFVGYEGMDPFPLDVYSILDRVGIPSLSRLLLLMEGVVGRMR
jgi:hypothetical protein